MKEYQDKRNFHTRQEQRLKRCINQGKFECDDYYTLESEGSNRRKVKYRTTPTGKLDPYVKLSLEAYNGLTKEQKIKYHSSMYGYGKDVKFHGRMLSRLKQNTNLNTFPSPEHGGESTVIYSVEIPKDDYDTLNRDGKIKYHRNQRYRNKGNKELNNFHARMIYRLESNSNKPIYYSPEHEKEEESK